MKFSQFLAELDQFFKDVDALMESDAVEWDPSVGREFAGTGVNTDRGSRPAPRPATAPTGTSKAKAGDVVVLKNAAGQSVPGFISAVDRDVAMIINPKHNMKVTRPIGSLQPAPKAYSDQMAARYPGKSVWVFDDKLNVPV